MKISLMVILATFMMGVGHAATWYSKAAGGAINVLTNWTANSDGTGANPGNFTTNGDIFIVQSVMTSAAALTMGGATGELRINSGSLTINLGGNVTVNKFTMNGGTLAMTSTGATGDLAITTGGNFTYNAGSFSYTGSRAVTFSGTTSIAGSGTPTFDRITINNGATTTTSISFTVTTSLTCNGTGTFTASGTSTVTFNGTTSILGTAATGPTFKNLTISGTSLTQNNTISNNITVKGDFTNNASFINSSKTVTLGTGGNITGSSTTTFYNLIINTAGATDKVLVSAATNLVNIASTGTLTLTNGLFKIGSGNTLAFGDGCTITRTAGNFANSLDLASDADVDGGTIRVDALTGSLITINNGPTLNNVSCTDGGPTISLTGTGNTRFNGTFTVPATVTSDQFATNGTSPIWGSSSTFLYNGNALWNYANFATFWNATSGFTIGTTPGYPNNVTLINNGSAAAISQNISINGMLTIGNGASTSSLAFSGGTAGAFVCGGIDIKSSGTLTAPSSANITVKGNFVKVAGGTFTHNSGTVTFVGGTSGSPLTITDNSSTDFNSITIGNGTSTYVKLNSDISLATTGTLTLTSGIIETSTNSLTILNTATTGIAGTGSATNYINGPVKWSISAAGSAGPYTFPVGDATSGNPYLPFVLNSVNNVSNTVTVQAFASASGGSSAGLLTLSTTEYWSMTTSATLTTGSTVGVTRTTAISPLNLIASSTSKTGVYSTLAGTVGTFGITSSNNIGITGPYFFTLAVTVPQVKMGHTTTQTTPALAQTTAANISQGSTDNIISSFGVNVSAANATLDSMRFTLGGTFATGDLTNIRLYTNSTNSISFPTTPLCSVSSTSMDGAGAFVVTFSGTSFTSLAQACAVGNIYFWITADVSSTATLPSKTVIAGIPTLYFASATITSNAISVGGTKTIIAPLPVITLNHTAGSGLTQTTASNVTQGSTKNILSNFVTNVTVVNATLDSLVFTVGGDFIAVDVTNFSLYTNTTNTFPAGAALSSVTATSLAFGSTVRFPALSQACLIGNRYFWITADISSGGTINKTIIVPATPTLYFASGSITNNITVGGTKTITAGTPVVTLDHTNVGQAANGNILQGSTNNILSSFRVNVGTANATLNSILFTGLGNFAAGDILTYKLYTNTSPVFGGSTLISNVNATGYTGTSAVSFSSLTQTCAVGTDRYFFITADVGTGAAAIGKTVQVPASGVAPALVATFASPGGSVTTGVSLGALKTISAATPVITLDHTGITQTTASNVIVSSTNNILSNFRVNVATADASLSSISFTIGGNFVAGDITNIKLFTSTTATFPGGGALSNVLATSFVGGSSTVTFSSLGQTCVAGVDRYFWITADIAASGTNTKTIIVPAAPTVTFALGTPTNSITVGGTKTIATFINYYNKVGSTDAGLLASWTTDPTGVATSPPANFTSGDKFTVRTATNITVTTPWVVSGGTATELIIIGALTQSNSFTLAGTFTNNGTFNNGNNTLTLGTNGSIGGSVATTFNNITINTTSNTDIVTLTKSGITMQNGSTITITKGIFKVGTGNIINMGSNGSTSITVAGGTTGNFASAADGSGLNTDADGGTFNQVPTSGSTITVTGGAIFYNIMCGSGANGNFKLDFLSTGARINGTLTIGASGGNLFQCNTNSPAWGPNSMLYINNNGNEYAPGGTNHKEWIALSPGVSGTTAGYPNDVTILNCGTSASNYGTAGNQYGVKLAGTWSINGTLYVGNSSTSCAFDMNNQGSGTNNFNCGSIVVDNNSKLAGPNGTLNIKNNWTRQGSTIGTYLHNNGTINFNGTGTSGSPQNITLSTGTESSLYNVTLSNGTYVKLNSPVTLPSAGTFTLTSGILQTDATNVLSITNTATTGITGTGSSSNFINGPVKWTLANSTTNKYIFPIGKSTTYLPFDITPANAQAGNIITVEAFNTNCGGTPDNVTVTGLSTTEYWSVSTTSSFTALGSIISTGRTSGIGSNNLLASSTTATGTYSSIGGAAGTVGGTTGLTNGSISAASPWFVALSFGPLSIVVTGTTYPSCTGGTGSVTVSGGGGTAPYEYKVGSGAYQSSGTFSGLVAGTYIFTVRDAVLTTKSISVTLDALVITSDTGTCSGGSVQLTAVGTTAYSYAWSPTTGLSSSTIANPLATPASTTTYTLTATIVDSTTNLITNGGFESGNTGFTTNYNYDIYSAANGGYFSSTSPSTAQNGSGIWNLGNDNHKGIYLITSSSQSLCVNLNSFGPRTGSGMYVSDGPFCSTNCASSDTLVAWGQTVSVTQNTDYIFSYWVKNAYDNTASPIIKTTINGTQLTGSPYTVTVSGSWTQITYLWSSGSNTSAAIKLYDNTSANVANDFALDDISLYGTCKPTKSVTVTMTPTPTLSVVSQPATACSGNGAVVSLTGLTAGTFTVSYKINGVAQTPITGVVASGGNATFTTAVLTTINDGQTLEVTSLKNTTGSSNCTQTFTGKTATISVSQSVTWLGTTNNNWNLASNWCGGIPVATSNVVIPDYGVGGVYPIITAGVAGLCNNIIINNNSSVTINSTGSLSIGGTYTSTGTLTNNGELVFNSSTVAQSFPGATGTISTMYDLTINNTSGLGVTFNRDISISDALTPTAGVINVNNALITLLSSNTATARVGIVGGTSGFTYTGTGKFSVERYLPMQTPSSGRRWRLLGVPISSTNAPTLSEAWQEGLVSPDRLNPVDTYHPYGTAITNTTVSANGFDQGSTSNPSIYKMEVGSGLWTVPASTTGTTITNYQAYMIFVRGDRSIVVSNAYINTTSAANLRIKGKIKTGNVTIPTVIGRQVLSNPYPSAISLNNASYNGSLMGATTGSTYYMWDPKLLGSKNVGGWVSCSSNGSNIFTIVPYPIGGSSTGMSSYSTNGLVESGGAFMINSAAANNFIFHEADKLTTSSTVGIASRPSRQNRPADDKPIAELYTNLAYIDAAGEPILADGVATTYSDDYHNVVDEQDAPKLQTFSTKEKISLLRDDSVLVIERRKTITADDTIFLQMNKLDNSYRYQLQFIGKNFAPELNAYLIDRYLHATYPISTIDVTRHNFSTDVNDESIATDRFIVVFKLRENSTVPVRFISINASHQSNGIKVEWNVASQMDTKEYIVEKSLDGIHFTNANVVSAINTLKYSWIDTEPINGINYFRIKSIAADGSVLFSEIVRINVNNEGVQSVGIYPNPITNNVINLQMNNIPDGIYTVALFNNLGQLVLSDKIAHSSNSGTETIQLKKSFSRGTYHLKIEGKETYKIDVIIGN